MPLIPVICDAYYSAKAVIHNTSVGLLDYKRNKIYHIFYSRALKNIVNSIASACWKVDSTLSKFISGVAESAMFYKLDQYIGRYSSIDEKAKYEYAFCQFIFPSIVKIGWEYATKITI